jgi:hypothetical protein
MTTKDIREAAAIYVALPRTNKFKRAVDLALAQDLPLSIKIAAPFKSFRVTTKEGKIARFKVAVRNTKTGQTNYFCRSRVRLNADRKVGAFRGCHYRSDWAGIDQMILRDHPDADLSQVERNHTGEHSSDDILGSISWSAFALAISTVCKKDFAHTEPCGKCSGSGFIAFYAHVDNGVCWDCCGSGQKLYIGQEAVKQ